MLHAALWPVLAVWMGLAVVTLVSIVAMIVWGTAHLVRDSLGTTGAIWCPPQERMIGVHGVPRQFTAGDPPFATLQRCERWGNGAVQCGKPCLKLADAR